MKNYLLSIFLLLMMVHYAQGQVATNYVFSQTQGIWEPISGGTVIWSGTFSGTPAVEVDIPGFVFDGTLYTSMYVSENGFITFGGAPTTSNTTPIDHADGYAGAISAFGANLHQAMTGNPEVSYKQEGNEFIIQWQDVRRYFVGGEIISFQIRLDIEENTISVIYGGDIVSGQNSLFPQVGLRGPDNTFGLHVNNRMIGMGGGDWINSAPGTANNSTMYFRNTSPETIPSEGLTFIWEPGVYIPCYAPENVTANNITIESAMFNWTAPNPDPPEGYEWEVRIEGDPGSGGNGLISEGSVAQGQTSILVNDLSTATEYYFYVRSNCGIDNYSVWTNGFHFTTACIPVTELPYNQGFESVSFPPPCWDNIQLSGPIGLWDAVTNGTYPTITPYEGLKMARFNCFNYEAGTRAALVSPEFSLTTGIYQVKFRMYRDNGYPSNADRIEIYLNNEPTPEGGIHIGTVHRSIGLPPEVVEDGWYLYEFDVEISTQQAGYFSIVGVSDYGNNIFLDQVSLVMQEYPSFELYPMAHNYGEVSTITYTDPFLFTLTNTGFGQISIDSILISGADASSFEFAETPNTPIILDEDEVLELGIVFNPEDPGIKQGELVVYTSIGTYTASLAGEGYEEPVFILPFIEKWEYASYDTNSWRYDNYVTNWQMRTESGNPPPTARFHWSPQQINYSSSLISAPISLENTGNHTFTCDVKMGDYANSATEFFKVLILEEREWVELASFTNSGDIPWTSLSFDLDTLEGSYTRIRFEATGSDSENINYWEIDNIVFNGQALYSLEVFPANANFGEVMTGTISTPQSFTYTNTGLEGITVNSVTIIGSNADSYILINQNEYPQQLESGESSQLSIQFAPQAAGEHLAQLFIETEIGNYTIELQGVGFDEFIGSIPFIEDWSTGTFTHQMWSFDQEQTNWRIQTNSGNPAPTARFNFSPIATNYSFSIVSPRIMLDATAQSLVLTFDLKLNDYNNGGTEWIKVHVLNGEQWEEVAAMNNNGSTDWINFQYNVSDYVQAETRVRFEASGNNSGFIANWEIDNIHLTYMDWPEIYIEPAELVQEIVDDGSAVQELYISNVGTGNLTYSGEITYLNPETGDNWLAMNPTSGTIAAEITETIEVHFNTDGLEVGSEYEALIQISSNDPQLPVTDVEVFLSIILSQGEMNIFKGKIHPNPAKELLYFSGMKEIETIKIIQLNGQTLLTYETEGQDEFVLNIAHLKSGSYVLQLISKSGIQNHHQLIIN